MLKTCFAASILAVIALAVPAQAQTQQERDDKACAEQGAEPDSDGYSACIAQRKTDRFQRAQKRAADLASMPKNGGNTPAILLPEYTHALGSQPPPQVTMSVKKAKVCVTEGDAANPAQTDIAGAQPKDDPQAICQTTVEVTKKLVQAPPLTSPHQPPGNIIDDHTQF